MPAVHAASIGQPRRSSPRMKSRRASETSTGDIVMKVSRRSRSPGLLEDLTARQCQRPPTSGLGRSSRGHRRQKPPRTGLRIRESSRRAGSARMSRDPSAARPIELTELGNTRLPTVRDEARRPCRTGLWTRRRGSRDPAPAESGIIARKGRGDSRASPSWMPRTLDEQPVVPTRPLTRLAHAIQVSGRSVVRATERNDADPTTTRCRARSGEEGEYQCRMARATSSRWPSSSCS